jgi:hypothetical protein
VYVCYSNSATLLIFLCPEGLQYLLCDTVSTLQHKRHVLMQ